LKSSSHLANAAQKVLDGNAFDLTTNLPLLKAALEDFNADLNILKRED
jgi:hypothetical protein